MTLGSEPAARDRPAHYGPGGRHHPRTVELHQRRPVVAVWQVGGAARPVACVRGARHRLRAGRCVDRAHGPAGCSDRAWRGHGPPRPRPWPCARRCAVRLLRPACAKPIRVREPVRSRIRGRMFVCNPSVHHARPPRLRHRARDGPSRNPNRRWSGLQEWRGACPSLPLSPQSPHRRRGSDSRRAQLEPSPSPRRPNDALSARGLRTDPRCEPTEHHLRAIGWW